MPESNRNNTGHINTGGQFTTRAALLIESEE